MRVVCAFKNENTYERLKDFLDISQIEWSSNVESSDEMREEITFSKCDLVIIDPRLWWKNEAERIIARFNVRYVVFSGDFEETAKEITPLVQSEKEIQIPKIEYQGLEEAEEPPAEIVSTTAIQYIEKEKIVEKQVIVEVQVPVRSYASIPSQSCLFLSFSSRAGATFLSSNLAYSIAKRGLVCTFIEHPTNKVAIYDQLNVFERKKDYLPPLKQFQMYGHLLKANEFIYEGVSLLLNHPEITNENVVYDKVLKLIYQARYSPVIVYDGSTSWHEPIMKDILPEFDHVFLVFDPDPVLIERLAPPTMVNGQLSKDSLEYELFDYLCDLERKKQINLHLVVNKYNGGVDAKLLNECMLKKPIYITHAEPAAVYKASWQQSFFSEKNSSLDDDFIPILKKILPPEYVHLDTPTKRSLWTKMKNKIKKESD